MEHQVSTPIARLRRWAEYWNIIEMPLEKLIEGVCRSGCLFVMHYDPEWMGYVAVIPKDGIDEFGHRVVGRGKNPAGALRRAIRQAVKE